MLRRLLPIGSAALSIAVMSACSGGGGATPSQLSSRSVTPAVVQENNGAPYVPLTFSAQQLGANPEFTSAVRATDGYVYFSSVTQTGPIQTVLVRVANDRSSTYFGPFISTFMLSNLAADSYGDVWFLTGGGTLNKWRHGSQVGTYQTSIGSYQIGGLAVGSDQNIYILYHDNSGNASLLKSTQNGVMSTTKLAIPGAYVGQLVNGPDGALYAPINSNGTQYAYRIAYTGQVTRLGPIAGGTNSFTVASGSIWYLNSSASTPTIYKQSTTGGTAHWIAPSTAGTLTKNSPLVAAGSRLWFMTSKGIDSFALNRDVFLAPELTNLPPSSGFVGTEGSDGNLWAASGTLGADQTPLASVVLTHVMVASPSSVSLFPGGQQTITITDGSGNCKTISGTSSNPSVVTLTKASQSCTDGITATFTAAAGSTGGSATLTFRDDSAAYRSNIVTVPVTVQSGP